MDRQSDKRPTKKQDPQQLELWTQLQVVFASLFTATTAQPIQQRASRYGACHCESIPVMLY
jgi:hypothetical protein